MKPRHSLTALAVIAAFSSFNPGVALAASDEQKSTAYAAIVGQSDGGRGGCGARVARASRDVDRQLRELW